jgi:hypothetical protein
MKVILMLFGGLAAMANCQGQAWLDTAGEKLSLKTPKGVFASDLTVLLDLEGYYVDQRPPALLSANESFVNPRASFFLDTMLGPHFYSFVQARLDRGFDAGAQDFDARLDEYLLRWIPLKEGQLNVQFGKFATVVGNWVQRHDSWQNPLITAPLPYENLTVVSDGAPPTSAADLFAERRLPDNKDEALPVIWGPVYATGGSVFGTVSKFDYAFEFKNAAISSHPYAWDPGTSQWQYPTFSGRLGFRPEPAWNHGVSFSLGPYLSADAQDHLPPGKSIANFNQITFDYDVSYAWGRLQLWSEWFLSRFEVPNVGNADVLTYYLEAKYRLTAGLYAAARWNQQLFGTVPDGMGGRQPWGNDMVRIDLALGYRFTRHLQAKIQYSFGHRDASLQQGEQLVAAQVTLKF